MRSVRRRSRLLVDLRRRLDGRAAVPRDLLANGDRRAEEPGLDPLARGLAEQQGAEPEAHADAEQDRPGSAVRSRAIEGPDELLAGVRDVGGGLQGVGDILE